MTDWASKLLDGVGPVDTTARLSEETRPPMRGPGFKPYAGDGQPYTGSEEQIRAIASQTGKSVEEVKRLNRENAARLRFGQAKNKQIGAGQAFMEGAGQGVTFGTFDEALAAAQATLDPKEYGGSWSDRYDQYLGAARGTLEAAREQQPVSAYGGEIAGGVSTGATVGAKALNMLGPGVTTAGRYARPIAVGAAEGALYGAGSAEGGPVNRLMGGAKGGVVGGVFGAGGEAFGSGTRRLVSSVEARRAARNLGTDKATSQTLRDFTGVSDPMSGAAQRIQRAGPEGMLADAGPEAQMLLDVSRRVSPEASRLASSRLVPRYERAAQDVTAALDDTLGTTQGIASRARQISLSTADGRRAAYGAAYDQPIDYAADVGRKIESVLDRLPEGQFDDLIQEANDIMREQGVRNMQVRARIDGNGNVVFDNPPNVMQLDFLKRALQTQARNNVDQFGRMTERGKRFNNLATDLRNALTEAVPEYGEAVRLGADKIAMDNALEIGSRLFTAKKSEVLEAVKNMSEAERAMVAAGARDQIDEILANVKTSVSSSAAQTEDIREAMRALREISSRGSREKLTAVLGEDQAKAFFDRIDRNLATFELRASQAMGSATQPRQAATEAVKRRYEGGPLTEIRRGRIPQATSELVAAALGRSSKDIESLTERDFYNIADALTSSNPLQAINEMQQRAPVNDAIAQKLKQYITQTAVGVSGASGAGVSGLLSGDQ